MRRILVVGVTGPSGSGKTTVARLFGQKGFEVIDADVVARRVIDKNPYCIKALAKAYGSDILNEDGTLNRKELAQKAFVNKKASQKLNEITHPLIIDEIKSMINQLVAKGKKAVVLDATLLYESDADAMCDSVVAVVSSDPIRLDRIVKRDGITLEQALARMRVQNDQNFYTSQANYVIINDGDLDNLKRRVDIVIGMILEDSDESRI